MKILSKKQIYEADKLTIKRQNITSTDLMERAATEVFNWMHLRMQGAQVPIHVFCGIGNNGGDGLVLARHLITHGYNVNTYVVNCSDKRSKDFLINYDRIKNVTKKWPTLLTCEEDFPEIHKDDIIVDAIFGIGLNRPIDDWIKSLFIHFKNSGAFTLSIDIPSGLYLDETVEDKEAVVYANFTLSFGGPKLVFFLPETAQYSKQWQVLDIGLDPQYMAEISADIELIGKPEILSMYMPREKFAHKGSYGHCLIIGGSYGKIGAVNLASRGALSSGAGLVTAYIPKCGYDILQTSFPEAMVLTDDGERELSNITFDVEPTIIGFGVGVGASELTIKAFEVFLEKNQKPIVIDADGINILSKKKSLLKLLPQGTVLTPHPKELERLIGSWKSDFEKLKKVKSFSKKYDLIIVIKGAHTITVLGDKQCINTSGNPGMATAGSGDVLTGIICGLMSQGYDSFVASIFGVYLHGKSADIAIENFAYQGLIASHIIEYLGQAYLDLFKVPEKAIEKSEKKEEPTNDKKQDNNNGK